MAENGKKPQMRIRGIGPVIRAAGLARWAAVFAVLFLVCALLITLFEPNVGGFGNALWLSFQIVTTIGLGDYTATTFVGRAVAVLLSVYSIFFVALITGAVVSYCNERMNARRNESVAHFIDQLEHLPELSQEELADISKKVKKFRSTM